MMRSLFEAPAISVGELCRKIRGALRGQFPSAVRVLGEISRCRTAEGGNSYFRLKDRDGVIDCFCSRDVAAQLTVRLPLEDGAAVEVSGFVDIFERTSSYQLRVTDLIPVGRGALFVAYEQLKARLMQEGLFDQERKRPIPQFIKRVAIVTSRDAAALRDFETTCRRRGAHVKIIVKHAPVQGVAAAPELGAAILAAGRLAVDVVVVARGGGSPEDLWAFNTEQVARAIAACAKPVISAIGHETDHTIADFVADRRAATPTAAAEMVAQELDALLSRITSAELRMRRVLVRSVTIPRAALLRTMRDLERSIKLSIGGRTQHVDELGVQLERCSPRQQIALWRDRMRAAQGRLQTTATRLQALSSSQAAAVQTRVIEAFNRELSRSKHQVDVAAARLQTLGPQHTLQRGYAIAYDARGDVLTSSASVHVGEKISVELKAGSLDARVEAVNNEKDDDGERLTEKS